MTRLTFVLCLVLMAVLWPLGYLLSKVFYGPAERVDYKKAGQ